MRRALLTAGLLWLAFAGTADASRTWLPPEELTAPGWQGGSHHVEVAADGTVIAAWITQPDDGYAEEWRNPVMAVIRPPGGPTPAPVEMAPSSGGSVSLAVNARGDAALVWHDIYAQKLMIARRAAGAPRFGEPEALPGPPQVTSNDAPVAIDEAGDVAVVDRDGAAFDRDAMFLGWAAAPGQPFEDARLLGPKAEWGLEGPGDVVVAPGAEATLLIDRNPHLNPEMGTPGEATLTAVTWRPGEPVAAERIARLPQGRSFGCAALDADAVGNVAARWLEGPSSCWDDRDWDATVRTAWRPRGGAFGEPVGGGPTDVVLPRRPFAMSGTGETLALSSPLGAREDTRASFGLPLAGLGAEQTLAGEPVAAAMSTTGDGLALLAERPSTDSYAARLVAARRLPGAPLGPLEDVRADCLELGVFSDAAIGAGGRAAILAADENWDLHLVVDGPGVPPDHRPCAPATPPDPAVKPPAGEPPVLPLPVLAAEASTPAVRIGRARVSGHGRRQTLSVAVRCAAGCGVAGQGRVVERRSRRVLARAKGRAKGTQRRAARVRLRFRLPRSARARASRARSRRYSATLRVAHPTGVTSVHRVTARR